MKNATREYYFSKNALIIVTIVLIALTILLSYLTYTTYIEPSPYNDKKFAAIIILSLLILFLVAIMRRYATALTSIFKNRPALILTAETLTDRANRKITKWSDIAAIEYKFHYSGKTSQHYITISLKDSDKEIKIAPGGIKCERDELLTTLIRYHNRYK